MDLSPLTQPTSTHRARTRRHGYRTPRGYARTCPDRGNRAGNHGTHREARSDDAASSNRTSCSHRGSSVAATAPERDLDIVTLLPFDGIPAIDNPGFFKNLETANKFYNDGELVLGVEIDGDARAYSVPFAEQSRDRERRCGRQTHRGHMVTALLHWNRVFPER